MANSFPKFTTHDFVINKAGMIGLVPNVFRYISDADWATSTGDTKAGHDFLEKLWAQSRSLVNEHTELHWDPRRSSDNPTEQGAYWGALVPWIADEGPQQLREMQASLTEFFSARWEAVFHPHGRGADQEDTPLMLRVVDWQRQVLRRWLADFAGSVEVLEGVNPTGKGANRFVSMHFLGAPAVAGRV